MWLLLAFISAILLGFYDVSKKKSVQNNAVIPVLFFSILFSSIIFTPLVLLSTYKPDVLAGTVFQASVEGWEVHKYIILKSIIVLSSWIFGYYGLKHLPITIVGPINATRPVLVLVGAIFIFGERLNTLQWIGVLLAILSFFMLSRSGKKEGIHFRNNKWIAFVVIATVLGAIGGLYDKFLMTNFNTVTVQAWYNYYQLLLLLPILAFIWWPTR
ncbi:MAG: DMT family transporter, partial [Bacteroides sp.]|nr:DMT family transporter [Bacteroides sp.]MDD4055586.1 DMT family transporter [Bacteroides sp.]